MTTDIDEIARCAGRLCAAPSVVAKTEQPGRRIGVAELAQSLNDPSRALTSEEQRALFTDPVSRADYRRLKAHAMTVELPALAAASSGAVASRRFEAGNAPSVPGSGLNLESAGGALVNRALLPSIGRAS